MEQQIAVIVFLVILPQICFGAVEGDTYFNTATNKLSIYDGSDWITLPAPKGTVGNPVGSAAELIADGQSTDGYYYIKFPNESCCSKMV